MSSGGRTAATGLRPRTSSYSEQMDDQLFSVEDPGHGRDEGPGPDAPLAARMRPRRLEDVVGQEHILGEGTSLRGSVEAGRPHSAILYGPPGTGKTSLARIIAAMSDGAFEEQSAVNAGRAVASASGHRVGPHVPLVGRVRAARARRPASAQNSRTRPCFWPVCHLTPPAR